MPTELHLSRVEISHLVGIRSVCFNKPLLGADVCPALHLGTGIVGNWPSSFYQTQQSYVSRPQFTVPFLKPFSPIQSLAEGDNSECTAATNGTGMRKGPWRDKSLWGQRQPAPEGGGGGARKSLLGRREGPGERHSGETDTDKRSSIPGLPTCPRPLWVVSHQSSWRWSARAWIWSPEKSRLR